MNKFKENLQVSDEIKEVIKAVEQVYQKHCREMSKEDKESLGRFLKILKVGENTNER